MNSPTPHKPPTSENRVIRGLLLGIVLICLGAAIPRLNNNLLCFDSDTPDVVLRPTTQPSFPVEPVQSLYKPLDPFVTKIVKATEIKLRRQGNNATDVFKADCLAGTKEEISALVNQPVFVKLAVVSVDQIHANPHWNRIAATDPKLDTLVRGLITWRSDTCFTADEKQKLDQHDAQSQRYASQGNRGAAQGEMNMANDITRANEARRPYHEVYITAAATP